MNNRIKVIEISDAQLIALMEGVPATVKIVSARHDADSGTLQVVIQDASFEAVPDGSAAKVTRAGDKKT